MKKTLSTLFCNMVTKQGLLKSDNGIVSSRNRSFKFPSSKLVYLLFVLVAFGGNVLAQQDIYWRSDAATNNWWDGNNPWYRTCDTWWLARPDYNVCSNNTTIGGNYIHFDNNNRTSMTVNGAWFKALTITFESAATSARTLTADGSGGLSFTASISYLTNLSSATHTFNTGIGIDNTTLTINAASGALIFNNPIFINANALVFTGGNNSTSNGEILGTGSLTKSGLGILTLNGTNSYTGSTLVSGGTLSTSKSLSSSLISVSSTATFSVTDDIAVNSITLDNNSFLNIATGKTLTINGTLTLSGSVTISGGGTIAYGLNGVLTYNGTNFSTTSDVEFPASGPKDLNITVVNASGITLHANRTIAGNMTIASGKKFIIPAAKQFTVNGSITNDATAAGFVVQSGGSLIQNSAVSATVERYISAWGVPSNDHGWHFLSSPVAAQTIVPEFVPSQTPTPTTTEDFYCWWETTNEWVNYKNIGTSPTWLQANGSSLDFIPGKGYLVEYEEADTKQFKGTLNKDNVEVSNLAVSAGAEGNHGWHLLGNPFTSALTWGTAAWSLTHINATAKIWDEANATYADIDNISPHSPIIPALNGFMVQVTDGFSLNNSLTIPAAARLHSTAPWYKSSEIPYIILIANDLTGQTAQSSVVRFDNQATAGFDPAFDSHFLGGYAPKFYSLAGTEQLSTNTLPEVGGTVQIPLAFIKNNGTSFTIQAKTISNLFGPVILNDLKTNATQDLTVNPVYSFTSESEDNPNRFLITFSHLGLGDTKMDNAFTVTSSANSIIVVDNTGKNEGNVSVYNMMGQLVATSAMNGNASCKLNLNVPAGYYLVKVISSDQTYSTKVFINQR